MARSNIDAIFQENPFLNKVIPRSRVREAKVNRWDRNFFSCRPDSYPDSGTEKIYLIDENGEIVSRVGTWKQRYLDSLLGHPIETVGQTLGRLKEDHARRVKYAVNVWNGDVTLWRLPNPYNNAADMYRDHMEKSRLELREAL